MEQSGEARSTQLRLVMRADVGPARAALYASDADRRDGPLFRFPLAAYQPVPRIEPGAVVEVHGTLTAGARPRIVAAGVEIIPAAGLEPGGGKGPMLQEDHRVIIHPDLTGWAPPPASEQPRPRGLRRLLPAGRSEPTNPDPPDGPAVPMEVELVWTVGPDTGVDGPLALARLHHVAAALDADPVAILPVSGADGSLLYDRRLACEVVGDPAEDPVIRIGDVVLTRAPKPRPAPATG